MTKFALRRRRRIDKLRLGRPVSVSRRINVAFVVGALVATFVLPVAVVLWVKDPTKQNAILSGLMASTVALLLTEHFRYYNRTPKLARLECALENRETYEYLDRVLTYEKEIAEVLRQAGPGSDFFLQRVSELREASAWADLAAGQVRLSPEEEFPARLRFVELARSEIIGVSFDEEHFWRGQVGSNYLAVQEKAISDRNLSIIRIFVGDASELHSWQDIFARHEKAGVTVLLLDPESRIESDDEDFNMYDKQVVRFAGSKDGAQHSQSARSATFSVRPGDVRRYQTRVESLMSRSADISTVMKSLDAPSSDAHSEQHPS